MKKSSESFTDFNGEDFVISGLAYDSRKVKPGFVFFAIKGLKDDGSRYIDDAFKNGASAVVVEANGDLKSDARLIATSNVRRAMSSMSGVFTVIRHQE